MKQRNGFLREMRRNRTLYAMLLPAVLLAVVILYIPMAGLVVAFKNYQYNLGIFDSPWAKYGGFDNFRFLFISGKGFSITLNTAFYNLFNLVTSQALSMVVAIVITEMRGRIFKRATQSVIFLPYFISWIIVGSFAYNFFNYEIGSLNNMMEALGGARVNLYGIPGAWVFIIMAFNCWKWVGYNSIIYIAAITSIDAECYEAADIDGANIWRKIAYITLPSVKPTVIVIFLLNISRILRGDFQMFFQLIGMNGQLFNATDVIDTYVFRSLISGGDVGMTAAATLYQSVLCFLIIIAVNWLVKRTEPDYALF
ncbi:MAG: ABC transporter permease subunit [Oscillospiraceae bacterium]|jgi:putative aldouronate transport system permease protein|nr:ABC transporter permease subunit [Oscillospiraceae bacterium]